MNKRCFLYRRECMSKGNLFTNFYSIRYWRFKTALQVLIFFEEVISWSNIKFLSMQNIMEGNTIIFKKKKKNAANSVMYRIVQ